MSGEEFCGDGVQGAWVRRGVATEADVAFLAGGVGGAREELCV